MIIALHGVSIMYCNLITDIRVAFQTNHKALEIEVGKLLRYLDQGFEAEELLPIFRANDVRPVMINSVRDIDRVDGRERDQLLTEVERLCIAAAIIQCPTIQIVAFCRLEGRSWREILKLTARNVADIADIGKQHGVSFQFEPIAWAPIYSLSQSLQVIEEADRDNVAMVIDFWHLYAGGGTTPDEVAKLDSAMIYSVHFCDGVAHKTGTQWNEAELRGYLPGDGEIPIDEWVSAVKSTGFDGIWSCELVSPKHWEWDPVDVAQECRSRMERYLS